MRKDIKVSFKDNPDEDKLHDDIISECKLIGQSAWMKIAAREKLERDHGSNSKLQKQRINQTGFNINDCSDLFMQQ